MRTDYDFIVIGAGSAGLIAARFARQLGLSVAMVEKSRVGGDCTWTGCVPSKALVRAAGIVHSMRSAERFGLPSVSPAVDLGAVMGRIRSVIGHIYNTESPEALAAEGIDVIDGAAKFTGPSQVEVEGRTLIARRFLICTGAYPVAPPIPGLDSVGFHTYETVWDMEALPASLAVVGAGSVGCELAQAFARLGSQVTLVEAAQRILPHEDEDASEVICKQFAKEGVRVVTNGAVSAVSPADEGGARVRLELADGRSVGADTLLVAAGRRANTDDLGLDEAGIAYGSEGIRVDRYLRTTAKGVYAAGDVTGGPQFTHYAGWQGFLAVRNAFLPSKARAVLDRVPRAIFTDPEVAQTGLTEAEAKNRLGGRVTVSRWPLEEVDRALTDGEADGFVKVVRDGKGAILGATIVAPRAGEMIHEWTLAMDKGIKLGDMARSMHVYPTYSMASQHLALRVQSRRLLGGRMGALLRWFAGRG